MKIEKVNLQEKLSLINDHWHPRIISELNGQHVKLVKSKGEFVWHKHDEEDELFFVISGKLAMELRDKTIEINPGEMIMIPRGVEHRPIALEEVSMMVFEPISTLNTGDSADTTLTKKDLERI